MAYRKNDFAVGEFYHVYNRGNGKQAIFKESEDYVRFQQLLFLCNGHVSVSLRDARDLKDGIFSYSRPEPLVAIGAYCLMSNHFHLLLKPLSDDGVSQFMRKLGTGYSMFFNKKYDRSGGLFEGKFKAKWADNDEYLKYLFAYIHLNPIAKTPRKDLGEAASYKFSSLRDYLDETRDEGMILQPDQFPEYFASSSEIKYELMEWLAYAPTSD